MIKNRISILILTHNAPKYVEQTLVTLNEVTLREDRERCEVVVLDNASEDKTLKVLLGLKAIGYIDKLKFSAENTFFARGNNLAAQMSSDNSNYFLLLNSDISIRDPLWLRKLIEYKESGGYIAASYGLCSGPERADGYCFLIDREQYERHKLDENFQWWGGVTKLQCELLREGHSILAIDNHDSIIYHYGGKSGRTFKQATKAAVDTTEVVDCFKNSKGKVVVESIDSIGIISGIRKKVKKIRTLITRL